MRISAEWQETTIGELIQLFDHKRIPLNDRERKTRQGSFPYYGASGVIDFVDSYIFDGKYLLIAEDGENLNSRKLPVAFFASGKFWVNNHAHIVRALPDRADDYFLKAWFDQANISGYITGAAQPKLSQSNLKGIKLFLPPLPTQRKIAAILSAYDDLIENNARRIQILEEMAQALYHEWFVHFRFPGCESVKMVKSAVGIVPEGWKTTSLGDVAEVNAASVKRGQEPEEISYVDIASVNVGQIEKIEQMPFASAPGRARRIVTHGDTIWSCVRPNRRSYALIINPVPNLIVSTGFAVITPKLAPYSYVYYATTTNDFVTYLSNRATGAAYPAVTADGFKNATILLPPQDVLESFHETVVPAHDLIQNLRQKNANLLRTRDLLLPKLVSGEIEVEELDILAGTEK